MWTSSALVIVSTIGGLLALWRDEIISKKTLPKPDESEEEKNTRLSKELIREKTIRIKLLSSLVICLTLFFTLYQIKLNNNSAHKAREEERLKHVADSTRYAKDSINHIFERQEDALQTEHLLLKASRDSISFQKQDVLSKRIISTQKYAISAQERYIAKADEFNAYLEGEISKEKKPILPLRFFIDLFVDESFYKVTTPDGDSLRAYFLLDLQVAFYDKVTAEDSKSMVYLWDSASLRLDFSNIKILHWFREKDSTVLLRCIAEEPGYVLRNNRHLTSILELENKIMNINSSGLKFDVRNITLLTGLSGSEQNTDLALEELFDDSPYVIGNWFKIRPVVE